MRTHTGKNPYTCSQYDYTFSSISNHEKKCTHTLVRNCILVANVTMLCHQKVFDFTSHMRTHAGENPFTCTECDKFFCQTIILKNIQTYTGEKQ